MSYDVKLGYLTSRYPAVSHTFIAREVAGLRDLGAEVHTFSIRRALSADLLTNEDRREADHTFSILPASLWRIGASQVAALLRNPGRYLSTLCRAMFQRPPGLRAFVWHLFYFVEAGILAAELRKRGIEHLHTHFANVASNVAMMASWLNGSTWSITLHGLSDFSDPQSARLRDKMASAAFVRCVSDYGRAQAMLYSDPNDWDRLHVVRCGFDCEKFSPRDSQTKADPTDGPVRLLTVARLGPEKGHAVLLEALAQVVRNGVNTVCTFVGDGVERKRLETQARQLGVDDRVTFAGSVGQETIQDYYDDADVFVLPSFAEGLPVVLMEAMAKKLPVIATRITGIPELVEHQTNGLLVTPGRADLLADAITNLAGDPSARARMSQAGRDKVCGEYDVGQTSRQLWSLYEKLLGIETLPDRTGCGRDVAEALHA